MSESTELLRELIQKVESLQNTMNSNFKSVNKRLDGIEYELKKINTVMNYQDQYDNIAA